MKSKLSSLDLQTSIASLLRAAQGGNTRDFSRKFAHFARAIASAVERTLRAAGTPVTELADLRQEVLLKVYVALCKSVSIANPEAWLREVCRNAAFDCHRRSKVRKAQSHIPWADESAVDETTARDHELIIMTISVGGPESANRTLELRRLESRILAATRTYAKRAEGRGHQVLAWYGIHIADANTAEVLKVIATYYGRTAKVETLWQWKHRGTALVKDLAEADEDHTRGDMMMRLVCQAA